MEVQRFDPKARRLAVFSGLALVVAGAVALWWFRNWLAGMAQAEPSVARRELLVAFAGLMGGSCAMLLALGVHLWRAGARVRVAAQFPPPGMRVLRDTAVLRGAAAVRRGRIIQGVGAALLVCCVGLVVATWRLYTAFASHAI